MFQPRIKPVTLRAGALLILPVLALWKVQTVRADGPMIGVPGWTSGSQTFIRARPSALTPPVAKVPTRTRVYVWGRFEDWYRVETKDHIFGWVHKNYIDARRLRKVKALSHAKAKEASDKGSGQTMYGTPAELKAYHARYGGSGAVKGLTLKGIYVAAKPAPVKIAKTHAKPVHIAQVPRVKAHLPRVVAQAPRVVAPAHRVAVQKPHIAPQVRVAKNSTHHGNTAFARPDLVPGTTLLAPPTAQELGTDRNAGNALRVAPDGLTPDASSLATRVHGWTPAAPSKNPVATANTSTRPGAVASLPPTSAPRAPLLSTGQSRPLSPISPRATTLMAPVAVKPASPRASVDQLHIAAWQARKRAKEQLWKWLQAKRASEWKWRQAQAQKRAIAAQNRRLWIAKQRENRHIWLVSRNGKQRDILGAKVGLAPKQLPSNVSGGILAPISPDEILQARNQYLKNSASQPASRMTPIPVDPGTPFTPSGLSSPATPRDLSKKLTVLLFGSRQQKMQTAQELSASSASRESSFGHAASTSGAPTSSSMPVPFSVPSAPVQPSSVAYSRGGSPRDRAATAWRSGVATQALSYRGMPYVFGSASPARGFDCSGLIYFLLRQRGLNPPRTAAGYRSYGTAVPRGQWQSGDLILFANTYKHGVSHIGVYLKDGKFVHAASSGQGVRVDSLMKGYFASKYYGARRVK